MEDDEIFIDMLNNVYLPERFTAIWHRDTELLEIIFTADPLPPIWSDLSNRAFEFTHRNVKYLCSFREASDRLRQIATRAMPQRPSRTQYRNLMSFQRHYFAKAGVSGIQIADNSVPYSFYVEGITWNDDLVVELANYLNFYMTYFDNVSPLIIIHTPESETAASQEVTRFPFGAFPTNIGARLLDENLLHFWVASREGDPFRRYIYNYQIIEYAATYHIEDGIRRAIRRAISAPNALDSLDRIAQQIVDAMGESKIQDPQKIEAVLKQTVDPTLIWSDIEKSIGTFSQPMTFEGGFVLQPIAKVGWSIEDFKVNWCPAFPNAIRLIRNALSHGRERTGAVILPTVANFRLLQTWVPLVATAAREVMVYRDVA